MGGTKKAWHPTATRSAWVPIKNLSTDSRYERPLSKRKVAAIAKDLDPDAIGQILVSARDDETIVIIDGQHRVAAVRSVWSDSEAVPCLIYSGLTLAEEADLFVKFNELRTRPQPLDLFKAKLLAGDETAVAIDKVCANHGLTIGTGRGTGRISCVQAMSHVVSQVGADILDQTLTALTEAWGTESEALQGVLVYALAAVIGRHRHRIDYKRLVRVLTGLTPQQVIAKARFAKEATIERSTATARLEGVLAELIIAHYNKGMRDVTRWLRWDTRAPRYWWTDEGAMPVAQTGEDEA